VPPIDRLAAYLARLHPAWTGMPWESIGEETKALFRAEAREAIAIYEGRRKPLETTPV
jgi:hypothetical protein